MGLEKTVPDRREKRINTIALFFKFSTVSFFLIKLKIKIIKVR
jgi:hypothetical protein